MSTQNKNLPYTQNVAPDIELDVTLRPQGFTEYVGQAMIKKNLSILIQAAQKRSEALDHILLHGPSGLGKTTLAYIIAREFGSDLRITSGTALEKAGDVGSILTGLADGAFLFIDEVHRLNKSVEETLYPAMENYKLDIVIGKGTSAKTLQVKLPRFTIIAATTRTSLLSNPFRSRFGVHYKLEFYNQAEIENILRRSAKLLKVEIHDEALAIIARSSRFTPRIANHLLRRVRDWAQVHGRKRIDADAAQQALELLSIDEKGLTQSDRALLNAIANQFSGGPVGLKSLGAAIGEEEDTIEDVYEPYLMRLGLIERTARGRTITEAGREHINVHNDATQNKLL